MPDSTSLQSSPLLPAVTSIEGRPDLLQKARTLAGTLQLELRIPAKEQTDNLLLIYTEKGLQIQLKEKKIEGRLLVDFLSGSQEYRRRHGGGIKQALARAVGIKSGVRPSLFDITAGLGNDAFCLACLGCQVTMSERSPLLAALLADGLQRAYDDPRMGKILDNRLTLLKGESSTILQNIFTKPETIYMDPMYPHRKNSALNKQEMRIIRAIVGDDHDADKLLDIALIQAGKRVVVKRPKGAEVLNKQQPSHIITMKNSRYDVYMITPH